MSRFVVVSIVSACCALACSEPPAGEGEGEPAGEGEGEGEGEPTGEGEGEATGEGEGEATGEGEGEGEGETGGCTADGDCGASDVCRFAHPDGDGFVLDGVCGADPGGDAVGAACVAGGGTCGRGLCLANRCSQLCDSAADCALGQACEAQSFTLDDGDTGVAPICVPDASLPETACAHDADCASTGRLCNSFTDDFDLICGFAGGGNAFTGSCVSQFFENRTACQTGLCDGEVAGMCTRACTGNADCGAGLVCSDSPFTNVAGSYCAEPCATDDQCDLAAGRFCSLRDNLAGNGIDTVCIDPPGTKVFGDVAASGAECQTNLEFQGRCTQLCNGGGCGGALPNCTSVNFPRPGGGADQPITICGP
jgi:hypothetical protein